MVRAALALLSVQASAERTALFWLVPYANLTSVDDYTHAWRQYKDNYRPGYMVAGSAYAAKTNGSLGYADTSAGEGEHGILMEKYGFPAAKQLGLRTLGMVYVTHFDAIKAVLARPKDFIDELMAKADAFGLDGFDIDYEPQSQGGLSAEEARQLSASFMDFMGMLASRTQAKNMSLTIDIGDCSPQFFDFACGDGFKLPGLTQVNTMSTFGARSADDVAAHKEDGAALQHKWAPGFEPGNSGEAAYKVMLKQLLDSDVSRISTWQVHESNVGDQPQWFFDAVNAFLDGTEPVLV